MGLYNDILGGKIDYYICPACKGVGTIQDRVEMCRSDKHETCPVCNGEGKLSPDKYFDEDTIRKINEFNKQYAR
jgi:hypothetical protein